MEKYLNKFYEIIDKIGKHNFVLIVFIFVALLSTGLYQTFSLYTESEGLSILDNIKTYSFILKANNEENSIVIAPNSSKNIDVTVTNEGETDLKYGLYYNTTADASDINIGYLVNTAYLPSGVVPKSTSYIVTLKVDNLSDENVTINFGLKYGFEDGGDLGIEEGNYWFNEYEEIITYPLLSEMAVGSYVAYTGNNGCDTTDVNGWSSCSGKNANYVDDTNMGSCPSSSFKFNKTGWRVGYIKDGSAHLVAAGATDCMCTDSNGDPHSDTCSDYVSGDNLYKHIDNMDNLALKYCNTGYAKGGVCNNTTAWAIDENDYEIILNETLDNGDISIRNNELMLLNADYWFGTIDSTSSNSFYYWHYSDGWVRTGYSNSVNGVRPVLSLDPSIIVVGGTGVYEDPYIISNSEPEEPETPEDESYLNTASVGSYVAYTGNNGCDTTAVNGWTSCSGKNANYVDDNNMGWCFYEDYEFSVNGWKIGYIEDGSVHLVAAGSTDCMCTDSNGDPHSDSCSSSLSKDDINEHIDNMDSIALNYCNTSYAKGGVCDNTTAWGMDATDFEKITNNDLTDSCFGSSSSIECGLNNDLIDNGSYYWFGTQSINELNFWTPSLQLVTSDNSRYVFGVRPVLSLDSSVRITGGTGTYADPYIISNE